ncbi:MAG: hypothetical protein JXK05_04410 [Campylobacterales bacterium]|nr:hypothetical protein [Campylobacterales bacterium]
MKRITTLSLAAVTALLIGCGGGSSDNGGDTPKSSSSAEGSTSSAQAAQSEQSRNANNLAGYTVEAEQEGAVTVSNYQKFTFIFLPNNACIVITDYFNGERKVVHTTYSIDDTFGIAMLTMVGTDDQGELYNNAISLNASQEVVVGESLAGSYITTAIVSNSDNGIDENAVVSSETSTPSNSSTFTINSVDDVKGYTITSNESSNTIGGAYTMHQKITASFKCDGTFEYKIITSASGASSTTTTLGDTISLNTDFEPHRLSWSGTDNEGEVLNDSLELNTNNQLVIGSTCWSGIGDGSGESCPNNLYVYSVTKDATCN